MHREHEDENPKEELELEGIPADLYDQPPGIDVETESEGIMAPRDHSIASGSDPAYPNTAEEERRPESVADRARREQPDFGQPGYSPADDEPRFRLLDPDLDDAGEDVDSEVLAELADDEGELSGPEEAAMHVVGEDAADDLDPAVERAEYLEGR
ncbi:MAG: hypothetical protein JWM85_1445 [Acidimicrobiaceae bacterium]|nr:hypothetical protein [Acidimicrobiaceae bacterium]